MKATIYLAAVASILAITGCSKNDDDNNSLNDKDKDFMNKATYSNLGEIESGNMSKTHATNSAVLNYGNMMVNDHGNAHNELTGISTEVNFQLPAQTDQEHKDMAAMLDVLYGRKFDSSYMYMMVAGHDKAIALFQDEATNGRHTRVKNFAKDKLAALQHHRHMADSIANAAFPR